MANNLMCMTIIGAASRPTSIGGPELGRPAAVTLPNNYNEASGTLYPVVVLLHGLGENPDSTAATFFGSKARAANAFGGCIVVQPLGTPNALSNRFWDPSDPCCRLGFGSPVADTDYLAALIELVLSTYACDRHFVVVLGYSNGGIMAQTLALCRPDLVAHAVSLAGFLVAPTDSHYCNPALRPKRSHVTLIHGNIDGLIRFLGVAAGDDLMDVPSGTYRSFDETRLAWRDNNGGSGAFATVITPNFVDGVVGNEATVQAPSVQAADASVVSIELNMVGHNPAFNATFLWWLENRIRDARRSVL